jgi:hypothetical protein
MPVPCSLEHADSIPVPRENIRHSVIDDSVPCAAVEQIPYSDSYSGHEGIGLLRYISGDDVARGREGCDQLVHCGCKDLALVFISSSEIAARGTGLAELASESYFQRAPAATPLVPPAYSHLKVISIRRQQLVVGDADELAFWRTGNRETPTPR